MVDVSSDLIEEEIKLTAHGVYESVSRVCTGATACAPDWHFNLLSGTEQHLMAQSVGGTGELLNSPKKCTFSEGLVNSDYRKCLSSWSQVSNSDPSGN